MQLRRCTRGLCLIASLIICCAYILDDMAVLLAGCTIILGIAGQYLVFDRQFRETVASVKTGRVPERTMVRKGTTLRVATSITLMVPPRMQVEITERVAPGAALQDGTTAVTAVSGPDPQAFRLSYRITPVIHGEMPFPGISMVVQNLFFSDRIDLAADTGSSPTILVQPTGLFDSSLKRSTLESREIEKMSALSGFGIRALREYNAGDDSRNIDWKRSAKQDRLFVREYTGMITLPPLLIVDLPWSGEPVPDAEFSRLVTAVAGMAEYSVKTFHSVSILLVSGPNILEYIGEEKDIQRGMSALREWMHPVHRTVHLYHIHDRADLRQQIRLLENQIPTEENIPVRTFFAALHANYLAAVQHQRKPAFSGQLVRTLSPLPLDDIFLFSGGTGDVSHIRIIIRQARSLKFRVHVRVPDTGSAGWSRMGADTVEAFA